MDFNLNDLLAQALIPSVATMIGAIILKWQNYKQDKVALQKSKEEIRVTSATALDAMQNSYDKFVEDSQKQYDRLQQEIASLNATIQTIQNREREAIKELSAQATQIQSLKEQMATDKKLIADLTKKVDDYERQKVESDKKIAALEQELKTYRTRE